MLRITTLLPVLALVCGPAFAAEPATTPASVAPAPGDPPIRKYEGRLVDLKGRGLYTWDGDKVLGRSDCTMQCRTLWPPIMAKPEDKPQGQFTLATRPDGSRQWALRGRPLYRWASDRKWGDAGGARVEGWKLVKVAMPKVAMPKVAPTTPSAVPATHAAPVAKKPAPPVVPPARTPPSTRVKKSASAAQPVPAPAPTVDATAPVPPMITGPKSPVTPDVAAVTDAVAATAPAPATDFVADAAVSLAPDATLNLAPDGAPDLAAIPAQDAATVLPTSETADPAVPADTAALDAPNLPLAPVTPAVPDAAPATRPTPPASAETEEESSDA